jgi:DNA-binding PadR family transcriptional regulator
VITGLDEPHGLALKDERELYFESAVPHGRLYPDLDTLVDKGGEKGSKDCRTNVYAITQRGGREIDARREWEQDYLDW